MTAEYVRERESVHLRTWEAVTAAVLFVGAVVLGVLGFVASSDVPSVRVGANGPLSVTEDLASLAPTFPTVPQQRLVEAQLAACTSMESGQSYEAAFTAVGDQFDIAGQPRLFLTTSAVDTFCFDQDSKITAWSEGK